MKAENDLLLWNARVQQVLNNFEVGSIVFDPDFPFADVYMDQRPVNTPSMFPADFEKLVMSVGVVENDLLTYAILRWGIISDLANDPFNDFLIRFYSIHLSILSSSTL